MPPFEYDPAELFQAICRLATERDQSWRFTKKGDKRPAYDIEAGMAARRRNIKARTLAATERREAAARATRARPAGQDIVSRMLLAMRSGQWYGAGDLARMIGESRSSRGKVSQVMLRQGWVETGHNPAYSGVTLNPWEVMAGAEPEPKTLYRLTAAGMARRGELADIVKPA